LSKKHTQATVKTVACVFYEVRKPTAINRSMPVRHPRASEETDMNTSIILAFDAATSIEDQISEINRVRRLGKRVLAIVEAPGANAREALARANAMPATTDVHVQAWVRLAPARVAAMELRAALDLPDPEANLLTAQTPVVRGPALDAEGRTVSARALERG